MQPTDHVDRHSAHACIQHPPPPSQTNSLNYIVACGVRCFSRATVKIFRDLPGRGAGGVCIRGDAAEVCTSRELAGLGLLLFSVAFLHVSFGPRHVCCRALNQLWRIERTKAPLSCARTPWTRRHIAPGIQRAADRQAQQVSTTPPPCTLVCWN